MISLGMEVISAHVNTDTPKSISVSNIESFHMARVPSPAKYTNSEEISILSGIYEFTGYDQFYRQHCYSYNQCNDRGNTCSRNSEENSIPSRAYDFTGYGQFYGQHCYIYNQCNDRVGISLDSSCYMPLDLSPVVTTEQLLPGKDENVWRPW